MQSLFKNKRVVVTGGTGSFGKEFVRHIVTSCDDCEVIVFSRDELKQFEFQQQLQTDRVKFRLGDIRNLESLTHAFRGADYVIHAAALKQVPAAESNPLEFIDTNVLGSVNVLKAATEVGVSRVVALSTDKASSPLNLYGATKLISDKMFTSDHNSFFTSKLRCAVVRYGNVFGSRGSIVPLILGNPGKKFAITDPNMTRFSISLHDSVNFVIRALKNCVGGEILVPKLPGYRLLDLIEALDVSDYDVVGRRPGEKIHEEMIGIHDAHMTIEYDDFYLIRSVADKKCNLEELTPIYGVPIKNSMPENFHYSSEKPERFLSISEIKRLIETFKIENNR